MKIRALAAIGAASAAAPHRLRGAAPAASRRADLGRARPADAHGARRRVADRDVHTRSGKQFETDHPGVTVKFNYAGSSDLAQQIVNGAPADVFAAASDATMKTVTDASLTAAQPVIFAKNVLQIATPPGNPKGIATFADLAKPDVKVVVCAPQVPCGAAAAEDREGHRHRRSSR